MRKTSNICKQDMGHSCLHVPQRKLLSKENGDPYRTQPRSDMNGLNTLDTNTAQNAVRIGDLA
jgi:hypothetical protein